MISKHQTTNLEFDNFICQFQNKSVFIQTVGASAINHAYSVLYAEVKASFPLPEMFVLPSQSEDSEAKNILNLIILCEFLSTLNTNKTNKKIMKQLRDKIIALDTKYSAEDIVDQKEWNYEAFKVLQQLDILDENYDLNLGNEVIFPLQSEFGSKQDILNKKNFVKIQQYIHSYAGIIISNKSTSLTANDNNAMSENCSSSVNDKRMNNEVSSDDVNHGCNAIKVAKQLDGQPKSVSDFGIHDKEACSFDMHIDYTPNTTRRVRVPDPPSFNSGLGMSHSTIAPATLAQKTALPNIFKYRDDSSITLRYDAINRRKLITFINGLALTKKIDISTKMENIQTLIDDDHLLHSNIFLNLHANTKLQNSLLFVPPTSDHLKHHEGLDSHQFTQENFNQVIITNIPATSIRPENREHLRQEIYRICTELNKYLMKNFEELKCAIDIAITRITCIRSKNEIPMVYAMSITLEPFQSMFSHYTYVSPVKTNIGINKSIQFHNHYGITFKGQEYILFDMLPLCVIRGSSQTELPFLGKQIEHVIKDYLADSPLGENIHAITVPVYFNITSNTSSIHHTLPVLLIQTPMIANDSIVECQKTMGLVSGNKIILSKIRHRTVEIGLEWETFEGKVFDPATMTSQTAIYVQGLKYNVTPHDITSRITNTTRLDNIDYIVIVPKIMFTTTLQSECTAYILQKENANHKYDPLLFHDLAVDQTLVVETVVFGHDDKYVAPKANMFFKSTSLPSTFSTSSIRDALDNYVKPLPSLSSDGYTLAGKKNKNKHKK